MRGLYALPDNSVAHGIIATTSIVFSLRMVLFQPPLFPFLDARLETLVT